MPITVRCQPLKIGHFATMFSCADVSKRTLPPPIPDDDRSRSRNLKVTGRLRIAIEAMAYQGMRTIDAAAHANLHVNALYSALKKPHVVAHYKGLLQILRTGEAARNIHRLCAIRDAADNMPAVQAIAMLERMDEAAVKPGGSGNTTPGLTIQIITPQLSTPDQHLVVDASPTPDEVVKLLPSK